MSRQRTPSKGHGQHKQPLALRQEEIADKLVHHVQFGSPKLLFFNQIPHWQQDNEYILSGYR